MQPTILKSKEDASVNFVVPASDGGFFEARFVQRTPDYFIVYLSSHSGCNQTCRFCHLTATGQTTMRAATLEDFEVQANLVMNHYLNNVEQTAMTVHFNFMARGEPLLNPTVTDHTEKLFGMLTRIANSVGVEPKFKISSIMPVEFDGNKLIKIFEDYRAMLYYSLYSVDPVFRKKWIPKAMPFEEALMYINIFQSQIDRDIAIHGAYIKNQNDSVTQTHEMVAVLNSYRIRYKLNVVRYNPFDVRYGQEASESRIKEIFNIITVNKLKTRWSASKIVPRVGFDVKASCGMFVDKG